MDFYQNWYLLCIMEHSHAVTDLISLLGHCDLYFTAQWYCHITVNILGKRRKRV